MVLTRSLAGPALADDEAFRNVLKQSAANIPPFPQASQRASSVSTSTRGPGNRFVAPSRWLAPRLISPGASIEENATPDWIYLSRFSEELVTSINTSGEAQPNYVLGRYAYQIYRTGGLLDANVAGYANAAPSDATSLKGNLLWADLTALPGMDSAIKELPKWRHQGSWAQSDQLVRD